MLVLPVVVLLVLVVVPLPAPALLLAEGRESEGNPVAILELATVDEAPLVVKPAWLSLEAELAEGAREEEEVVAVGMAGLDVVVAGGGLAGTRELELVKQGM